MYFVLFHSSATAQVQLPELNAAEPIRVSAQAGNRWQAGEFEVWILRGDCTIEQGGAVARCGEAVLWIDHAQPTEQRQNKIIAYLEGNVDLAFDARPGASRLTDRAWFGRFFTSAGVDVHAAVVAGKPDTLPAVYWRGMERRSPDDAVHPAQFTATAGPTILSTTPPTLTTPAAPGPAAPSGGSTDFPATRPGVPTPVAAPTPGLSSPAGIAAGARRVRVFPRSDVPVQAQWFPDPSGHQWIAVIDSGVNVIVDGLGEFGTIDVSTDRLVIWTTGAQEPPELDGRTMQDERVPLEFYMEGNIVFRQGERVISADRMYYDVSNRVGTVLNADILTPVRNYAGLLRLHADVVQQTAQDRFFAQNAFLTSSRMGSPGYRLQAGDIYFEDIQGPMIDPVTGQQVIDPETGEPVIDHQRQATSSNNLLFVGPAPVFYWPMLSTDLNDPTYYIRRARVKNDRVFGTQILTSWSGYELLGIRNKPEGTNLGIDLDYLSKRGFGHGGSFTYERGEVFDIPGRMAGLASYWGIQDHGNDNLGQGRRNLVPEKSYRYRLFWQHRHELPYDWQLSTELGWISDRNFLEEYYKREWEELKDESTGLELKRIIGNYSLSGSVDYGLNDFFTHTDWLPRGDLFGVGQSIFNDTFTWFHHSNAGYARFEKLDPPTNPNDQPFSYLPWEEYSRQGERFATRHEIDWPFQFGAVKVVPYLMGEAAHWGQDINGDPLDRLWGQAGIRASMPMWSVDPTFNSDLWNARGLAHKVVFELEFSAADANQDMTDLPLYDRLDDNSTEAFRRHFVTNTFGWPSTIPPTVAHIPTRFDERYYALRSGVQNWATSSSTEIADDLMAVRLGVDQRWQTKRGRPDNPHIIDWITLDTNMTFFPNADRDDSGETLGLLDYDFRWHVGDRLTLVSDGLFDFFSEGQKLCTVGGYLNRPPRGSLYMGFRVLEGPINSRILALSYTYLMSPKWASTFGTSIDFGSQRSYWQNFGITRIGESLLINFGFSVDPSRDSVGVALSIEPRFLPKGRLGNVSGAQIPPAGAFGLE